MKTAGAKIEDQTEKQCDIRESLSFLIKVGFKCFSIKLTLRERNTYFSSSHLLGNTAFKSTQEYHRTPKNCWNLTITQSDIRKGRYALHLAYDNNVCCYQQWKEKLIILHVFHTAGTRSILWTLFYLTIYIFYGVYFGKVTRCRANFLYIPFTLLSAAKTQEFAPALSDLKN